MKKILLAFSCLAFTTIATAQLIPKHQMHTTNATQNCNYINSTVDTLVTYMH